MTGDLDLPALDRPAFFDGQRLTAADLDAVQAYHRSHRWLHNRALHGWGIVAGFQVEGARGDRQVRVRAGFALDCRGRELILAEPRPLPIPAVAGGTGGGPARYYLTISFAEDDDLTTETRAGVCGTRGAVRRPESPLIRFSDAEDAADFRRGIDVVLATIEVRNCRLAAPPSATARRDALPASQPFVAAGQTELGKTPWRPWPAVDPVGVATYVSTASAGFQSVPRYQAHVMGERVLDGRVIDGHVQIVDPSAEGFDLRLFLPAGVSGGGGHTHTLGRTEVNTVIDRLAQRYKTSPLPASALGGAVAVQRRIIIAANHLGGAAGFAVGQQLRIPIELERVTVTAEFLFGLPVVAARYGTSVEVIKSANNLTRDIVVPGERILVPRRTIHHAIDFEDDLRPVLATIAGSYGTAVPALMAANGLAPGSLVLGEGDTLLVPPAELATNDLPTAALARRLGEELSWCVVWMGVEG